MLSGVRPAMYRGTSSKASMGQCLMFAGSTSDIDWKPLMNQRLSGAKLQLTRPLSVAPHCDKGCLRLRTCIYACVNKATTYFALFLSIIVASHQPVANRMQLVFNNINNIY